MNFQKIQYQFTQNKFIIGAFLLFLIYYLFFLNRGIVLSDEGYSVHIAERILHGQIPYKDFFLQYPPLYFYLLAGLFKIFGISVIVGRLLSLFFCIGIGITSLLILYEFGIYSKKTALITLLSIASFGYPLINIPVVVWPTVFITEIIMIILSRWFKQEHTSSLIYISIALTFLFLIKQNIALTEMIVVNLILLIFAIYKKYKLFKIFRTIFFTNCFWIVITFLWVYFFFLRGNYSELSNFLTFNQRYVSLYPFSYPPLSYLLQSLGLFKLIPYYIPILFIPTILFYVLRKKYPELLILFLPLVGFFTTVFPTSDLLHVYPYYGIILISLLAFTYIVYRKINILISLILFLSIISGFYLTLFREYYRYGLPYKFQNTSLNLPRARNILIDKETAQSINQLNVFITTHTKNGDPIFIYSFSPMLYFLLQRPNPSYYSIYYPGYLTTKQEKETIIDIKQKHVKYIISDGFDQAKTPLSLWMKKQKKIKQFNPFTIYKTISR